MKKHHQLQIVLFLGYIVLATTIMISQGIGLTPDRYLIVLLAGALLIHHSKHFIHDFAPFIFIILAYDFLRGFADNINPLVHYQLPIQATLWLFWGNIPTVVLQNVFYTPGFLHWYDYSATFLYLLHFAMPLFLAFILWFYNRRHFREFMLGVALASYVALLAYLIYPVAPPWLASQQHFIPPITKILNVVLNSYPDRYHLPTFYSLIGSNLVAALPSMHAAYAFLVFLYGVRFFGKIGYLFAPYFLAMWFSIIYLGEHYFIDIAAGATLALIIFHFSKLFMRKYGEILEYL